MIGESIAQPARRRPAGRRGITARPTWSAHLQARVGRDSPQLRLEQDLRKAVNTPYSPVTGNAAHVGLPGRLLRGLVPHRTPFDSPQQRLQQDLSRRRWMLYERGALVDCAVCTAMLTANSEQNDGSAVRFRRSRRLESCTADALPARALQRGDGPEWPKV